MFALQSIPFSSPYILRALLFHKKILKKVVTESSASPQAPNNGVNWPLTEMAKVFSPRVIILGILSTEKLVWKRNCGSKMNLERGSGSGGNETEGGGRPLCTSSRLSPCCPEQGERPLCGWHSGAAVEGDWSTSLGKVGFPRQLWPS